MPTTTAIAADRRRVAVTGIGMVTPLGASAAEIRSRLAGGETAPTRQVPGVSALRLATIEGFEARPYFRQPKALKLTDRKTQLAVAAAALAVADAGLAAQGERDDWAIILGCSASDIQSAELARAIGPVDEAAPERALEDLEFFAGRLLGGLNPLWLLINLPNMVGAHVGIQLASSGPNHTLTADWIAGAQALGEAFLAVSGGEREIALAGGADAPLDPFDLGVLATHRPSPEGRPLTLAEGAAVWVLEELEHARRRDAREYGELRGYASSAAIAGDVAGAIRRAAAGALAMAGWQQGALSVIAPGGCPAHPWEEEERRALEALEGTSPGEEAFRRTARRLEVKGRLGHTLAAAGPIDGALLLAELDGPLRETPSAGLLLSIGTLGQCAALALAGPEPR